MTTSNMFRVTPVPENRDRKVSFSPDIDESYRHQVVDKIQGLMKEVEVRHTTGLPSQPETHKFSHTSNMQALTKNLVREFT